MEKTDDKTVAIKSGGRVAVARLLKPAADEQITAIEISPMPDGFTVIGGTRKADGNWSAQFSSAIEVPAGYKGNFGIQVKTDWTPAGGAPTSGVFTLDINVTPKWSRAILAFALLAVTAVVSYLWLEEIKTAESKLQFETEVAWTGSSKVFLQPGPPNFKYDQVANKLQHTGPVDVERKAELVGLIRLKKDQAEVGDTVTVREEFASYYRAIDALAFKANGQALKGYLITLLILGGIGGMVGVLIRALNQFVQVSAVEDRLDVSRWWPWYVVRPALGFLFGVVAILIVQAQFFLVEGQTPSGTVWWLAFTVIVGFGADEFSARLRLITKAVFGKEK